MHSGVSALVIFFGGDPFLSFNAARGSGSVVLATDVF